jgi:23S rRNA pseudouridine1911/1915/1917 synthase
VREKMMVCPEGGNAREAVTFYKTAESYGGYALIDLHPHTGRTHQLRVHMQHIACPIVADRMYIGQPDFRKSEILSSLSRRNKAVAASTADSDLADDVLIARQALHAFRLTIRHPITGKEIQFEAPLPDDFQRTLSFLRQSLK